MMSELPTYAQARALPLALTRQVPPAYGDLNGHMNVRHYLGLHDDASWAFLGGLGLGADYVERERRTFFDVEQHLRYHDELLVGETVHVHARLLGRTNKVVHLMSYLLNGTREVVANTFEVLSVHVDLVQRRSVAFDPDTAAALDRVVRAHAELRWPAPVSGALRLR